MNTSTIPDRATLYFREGSSDKVYQAAIEPSGAGFVVNIAFGRRGGTLQTSTKTAAPVNHAQAQKIFDKLIREKTAKGYSPGEDGTPYRHSDKEPAATGIRPQLLNAIDDTEAERLLGASGWCAQEKLDGRRMLLRRTGDRIDGINRNGLIVSLPEPILRDARNIGSQQWLMDGEAIGDCLFVFDLLENACTDLRNESYLDRLKTLRSILPAGNSGSIRGVETAITTVAKRALLKQLRTKNAEGIVFKKLDADYTAGRPASGGDQLKLKFTATASCLVSGANGSRRSVKLELIDDGGTRLGVGSVTIPVNQTIPSAGEIVEIRYLYSFPGGSLFQPVFVGRRDDVTVEACILGQLKIKAGETDSDN